MSGMLETMMCRTPSACSRTSASAIPSTTVATNVFSSFTAVLDSFIIHNIKTHRNPKIISTNCRLSNWTLIDLGFLQNPLDTKTQLNPKIISTNCRLSNWTLMDLWKIWVVPGMVLQRCESRSHWCRCWSQPRTSGGDVWWARLSPRAPPSRPLVHTEVCFRTRTWRPLRSGRSSHLSKLGNRSEGARRASG